MAHFVKSYNIRRDYLNLHIRASFSETTMIGDVTRVQVKQSVLINPSLQFSSILRFILYQGKRKNKLDDTFKRIWRRKLTIKKIKDKFST